MKREDVTNFENKEYVSLMEFAKRVGAGIATIRRRVYDGSLHVRTFDGHTTQYIEWETGKTMWDMLHHDKVKSLAGRASTNKRYGKTDTLSPEAEVSIPSVSEPTASIESMMDVVDLSSFDKEKYADCVLPNGEFDYDKLKVRLTAETYQQKLQKERGELVEKTEIVNWAKKLGTMLNSGLESIPQKYTSVLIAKVQSIVAQRLEHPEFEFTEKERTEIRTILKGCGPEIMRSIKLVVMEMEEE